MSWRTFIVIAIICIAVVVAMATINFLRTGSILA